MKDLFAGKAKYVAVSNSMGPCYLLRSDGKVDCVRSGEVNQTLDSPYVQIAGGTDCSYHLKKDGRCVRASPVTGGAHHSLPRASHS